MSLAQCGPEYSLFFLLGLTTELYYQFNETDNLSGKELAIVCVFRMYSDAYSDHTGLITHSDLTRFVKDRNKNYQIYLNKLEKNGYIKREGSRRTVRYKLTKKGFNLAERINDWVNDQNY